MWLIPAPVFDCYQDAKPAQPSFFPSSMHTSYRPLPQLMAREGLNRRNHGLALSLFFSVFGFCLSAGLPQGSHGRRKEVGSAHVRVCYIFLHFEQVLV